jgi:hypothetical protein
MQMPVPRAGMGHNHPGALLDVDALCNELERLGVEWADAKAAADALDDATKGVLGEAFARAEGRNKDEKEYNARQDHGFKKHLDAVDKARRRANVARVRYDVQQVRVELTRSNAATERSLANLR